MENKLNEQMPSYGNLVVSIRQILEKLDTLSKNMASVSDSIAQHEACSQESSSYMLLVKASFSLLFHLSLEIERDTECVLEWFPKLSVPKWNRIDENIYKMLETLSLD